MGQACLATTMSVAELTRALVGIPSHADETAAGDFLEEWLRDHTDAAVARDEVGNVIARRGPQSAQSLAFVGHHDVVPPDESQLDGSSYTIDEADGRLYGRGTADMKGGLAAMLLAFRDAEPAGELVFASFVGEETGGVGAQHAIDSGFQPDRAVVGEGSTNYSGEGVTDVVVAHKGRQGSTITARGRSAHASEPEAGENAIYRGCEAVDVLRSITVPRATVFGHELVGSLAVTGIEGGSAWNVIPERCTITVDERTVPGERAPLERVEQLEGVSLAVDQDLPPMRCTDEAFADAVLDAAERASPGADRVVKPHATDAGWLAQAGTACVVCGPAEPGEAHTATESVAIDVLDRCRRIYRAVAEWHETD